MSISEKDLEEMRMAFVGVWDFIGRSGPKLFAEINALKAERDHWKEINTKKGLSARAAEFELLRQLEVADRAADPERCTKSLNQKAALQALDDLRTLAADADSPRPRRARKSGRE